MGSLRILACSALLLTFILSACHASETGEQPAMETQVNIPQPKNPQTPVTLQNNGTEQPSDDNNSSVPGELVDMAKANLASFLHIEADQIEVVESAPVLWHDASLGCPKPGIDYIRVETPGYSIILETGRKRYTYHTDEVNRVVLCNK